MKREFNKFSKSHRVGPVKDGQQYACKNSSHKNSSMKSTKKEKQQKAKKFISNFHLQQLVYKNIELCS